MRRQRVQQFAFRTVSQTGIEYRRSPLSVSLDALPESAPQAGDRFPWLKLKLAEGGSVEDLFETLDDAHFQLLVFGQSPPAETMPVADDALQVHVIPADPHNAAELARVNIPSPSFYLLRPDGYVGLCGVRLDIVAVTRYIGGRLQRESST
jgi:hypothetical protein